MYGLEAIEHANGWAMAGAGACIVLTGLSVLSFLISMIPRLIGLFEKKPTHNISAQEEEKPNEASGQEQIPYNLKKASELLIQGTVDLGENFTLIALHKKTREMGVVNPHMTIRRFREAGILIPAGEEQFSWQSISD